MATRAAQRIKRSLWPRYGRFELVARGAGVDRSHRYEVAHRRGRLVGVIRDSVQARLRSPAPHQEIHRAVVRIDGDIRERKRRASDEFFQLAAVRRSLRREVQRVQLSIAPVAQIESILILVGKLRAVAKHYARRRARPDVGDRRQAVDVIRGPFARAIAIAKVAAAYRVQDARGAIPRQVDVPLHVRVVGEQLAVAIEGDIERIAIAHRDQIPFLAVGADAADVAAGRFFVGQ
jgi:hypothetical protein